LKRIDARKLEGQRGSRKFKFYYLQHLGATIETSSREYLSYGCLGARRLRQRKRVSLLSRRASKNVGIGRWAVANKQTEKRAALRRVLWPDEVPFDTPPGTNGWFKAFRTLPLVLRIIRLKSVTGGGRFGDAGHVYLELVSRHMDGGLVVLNDANEHAYAAGYSGNRAVRSWKERMDALQKAGFIKIEKVDGHYKRVLIIHPTVAVQRLRDADAASIPNDLWKTFLTRQVETKEPTFEQLNPKQPMPVAMIPSGFKKVTKKKVG
jgi:hypothetical protein